MSDVTQTSGLETACQPGLQALRAIDRSRITARQPRRLTGSVDVDKALMDRFPDANRWDYVAASQSSDNAEYLYWIEVHRATGTDTIGEVSAKLTWLKEWLCNDGARLNGYRRAFVWIATGRSAFQQNSPQLKRLAAAGIIFAGGHYTIPE